MTLRDSPFLRACRREPVGRTPVWFMRQAGRSLPEYRELRERYSFFELSRQPELCAQVTLQPVRRLGVDAAILFADIMTPLLAVGVELELVEQVGPVIHRPVRRADDLEPLRPLVPDEDLPFVRDAIRLVKSELGETLPLIGFAGAPFTLAAYLVEGRSSRTFTLTKTLMYRSPAVWHLLMKRLADITSSYLRAQLDAGVDAVQLFDSWVGCLGPYDYRRYVQPYSRKVIASLQSHGAPIIHFGTDTAGLLSDIKDDGASVVGVDWRVPLDAAWTAIGPGLSIQGNLDPSVLLGPWENVAQQASHVLERAGKRPGHIFNLGHGVHPETPVDYLERLVELVHER